MAKGTRGYGATSLITGFKVRDKLGNGVPALTATDFTISYWIPGASSIITYIEGDATYPLTDLTALDDSFSEGGLWEIDSTYMPGSYRFDAPDAIFTAVGLGFVTVLVSGYPDVDIEWQIVGNDPEIQSLPPAAYSAASGVTQKSDIAGTSELTDAIKAIETADGETWEELATFIGATILNKIAGDGTGIRDRADSKDRITYATDVDNNRTISARDAT